MDYGDLARRTASVKVLRDKTYAGYQRGLAFMIYKYFHKKPSCSVVAMLQNEQLAEELHKPIIKKIKRRRVYSSFKDY